MQVFSAFYWFSMFFYMETMFHKHLFLVSLRWFSC
jgi:hypothetical protein